MSLKLKVLRGIFDRFMAWRLNDIFAPRYPIFIEYPIHPAPRWGYDKPYHPELLALVEAKRAQIEEQLRQFANYRSWLERIPVMPMPEDPTVPYWSNTFFSRLDAIALYCFIAMKKPAKIIEIGSGNSTRFARRAIADQKLSTRLISIDPAPRAEVDAICDEVIRTPLESADLGVFERVNSGDFVFVDNSHRCFTNSDVTTFFLDVLPRLPSGTIVHIHDIFIPGDYPAQWIHRYYSEQYLLACYLLGASGGKLPSIQLPNAFISFDNALRPLAENLWNSPELSPMIDPAEPYGGIPGCHGTSFWYESP